MICSSDEQLRNERNEEIQYITSHNLKNQLKLPKEGVTLHWLTSFNATAILSTGGLARITPH